MAGTLTPTPYQTVLDGDGVAVSGAKITTTDTGTGVNSTTYTSADLSVANTNPIVADSAGRYVAYLPAGANLTFAITTSADVAIETQTNILSVPGASVNLDVEGTVGEAVTAGQVLYLSSAAEATPLTAGFWYLAQADAAPTSTTPQAIGVAVSAIAINAAGTIRLAGLVTTSGAVVVGTTYYVSATAGALASSAPALSRQVGVAMTTSSLLLAATTAVVGALPNPITQDLLFTDNTYDIGKSGATRPRDVFASRNAVIGGTLGVSGISTFTADLVATGASMSFQDAEGVVLGTGSDATIKYDGTNVSLDTQAVGSGLLIVTGSEAISGVEIDNTATDGDPTLAFTLSGTSLFTMGVDDGDSDKFKIGTTAIGTNTALTIDGSQNVGIGTTHADAPNTVAEIDYSDSSTTTVDNGLTLLNSNGSAGNLVGVRLSTSSGANGGGHPKQFIGGIRTGSDGIGDIVFLNRNVEDTSTVAASDEKLRITKTGDVVIGAGTNDKLVLTISGGNAVISSRDNMYLNIDSNADGTAEAFLWGKDRTGTSGGTQLMSLTEAGALAVSGALSKGSGSFLIDHPLPALADTHRLVHSFIEGPRADLIYRATVDLVDGSATVDLDVAAGMSVGTWVLLCRDEQVFTTNETGWFHVRGSVSGSTLTIDCEEATCTDTVSWMVVAERQDQHILDTDWTDEDGRPIVEPEKPA